MEIVSYGTNEKMCSVFVWQNGQRYQTPFVNSQDAIEISIRKLPGFPRLAARRIADDVAGEGAAAVANSSDQKLDLILKNMDVHHEVVVVNQEKNHKAALEYTNIKFNEALEAIEAQNEDIKAQKQELKTTQKNVETNFKKTKDKLIELGEAQDNSNELLQDHSTEIQCLNEVQDSQEKKINDQQKQIDDLKAVINNLVKNDGADTNSRKVIKDSDLDNIKRYDPSFFEPSLATFKQHVKKGLPSDKITMKSIGEKLVKLDVRDVVTRKLARKCSRFTVNAYMWHAYKAVFQERKGFVGFRIA